MVECPRFPVGASTRNSPFPIRPILSIPCSVHLLDGLVYSVRFSQLFTTRCHGRTREPRPTLLYQCPQRTFARRQRGNMLCLTPLQDWRSVVPHRDPPSHEDPLFLQGFDIQIQDSHPILPDRRSLLFGMSSMADFVGYGPFSIDSMQGLGHLRQASPGQGAPNMSPPIEPVQQFHTLGAGPVKF